MGKIPGKRNASTVLGKYVVSTSSCGDFFINYASSRRAFSAGGYFYSNPVYHFVYVRTLTCCSWPLAQSIAYILVVERCQLFPRTRTADSAYRTKEYIPIPEPLAHRERSTIGSSIFFFAAIIEISILHLSSELNWRKKLGYLDRAFSPHFANGVFRICIRN